MRKRIAFVGVVIALAFAAFLAWHEKERAAPLEREGVAQSTAEPSAVELAATNGSVTSTRTGAEPEPYTSSTTTEPNQVGSRRAARSSSDPTYGLGMLVGVLKADAGASAAWQCSFDANAVIYVRVIRIGIGAQYEIKGPAGSSIPQSALKTDVIASDAFLDEFECPDPPTGTITIKLTAGAGAASTLSVAFLFGNGTRLASVVNPLIVPRVSGTAQLSARLEDKDGKILAGQAGSFSAILVRPDGSRAAVAMFDDGRHGDGAPSDGVFGAMLDGTMTTLEGRYSVFVSGSQRIGDSQIERSKEDGVCVSPSGAVLVGEMTVSTPDNDRDGIYDALQFSQQVSFNAKGRFMLVGNLRDSDGSEMEQLRAEFTNKEETVVTTLTLAMAGDRLVYHGVDGPWSLTSISLVREDAGWLPVCTMPDVVTQPYELSAFKQPPAPTLFQASPGSGSIVGGNEIVVSGSDLFRATSVLVGGQAAVFTVRDNFTIAVTAPRATVAPPYPAYVEIKVTTPWGVGSLPRGYAYGP